MPADWWGRWQRGRAERCRTCSSGADADPAKHRLSFAGCVQSTRTISSRHRTGIYKPQSSPSLPFPVRSDWEEGAVRAGRRKAVFGGAGSGAKQNEVLLNPSVRCFV